MSDLDPEGGDAPCWANEFEDYLFGEDADDDAGAEDEEAE